MKKITLLMALFAMLNLSAQVLIDEDFEGGLALPAGWSITDIPGNGEVWTFANTGTTPKYGGTPVYTNALCSGNYAEFDSDDYGNNGFAEESAIVSPAFDCTGLTTDIYLEFNHFISADFGSVGNVQVFNGTSWVSVANYTGTNPLFGRVSIDVSTQLANVANAQVRFLWTGDWGYAWHIDNITVFQCSAAAPSAATNVAPADGATDVPIDITNPTQYVISPFSWTAGAAGGTPTTYNLTFGTDPAGTNIGTVNGATSGNGIQYGTNWAYNTTYYWSVTSVNCGGQSTSAVWSFTTEEDPTLTVDNFEANNISHFYNSDTNVLTLKSSTQAFTNATIYSITGQEVLNKNLSQINESINLSSFSAGVYIAKVSVEGKTQTIKFVKK